jgi:aryl-alcohol dehydrogenase-like predicted oxidoreductase
MEKRTLGKTGLNVSILGFGGAEIGFHGIDKKTVEKLLLSALEAGLNVIDTAECYVSSEELIGATVSNRRKDFYLFTKVGHTGGLGTTDWSKPGILKCVDRSLQRLKTDYVDIIQLHSCDQGILARGEVVDALQTVQQAGKARFIGYSGDSTDAQFAIEMGVFDTLQTSVSIADQEAINLTIPAANKAGMGVIAKRPIANVAWRLGNKPVDAYSRPYWERLKKLEYNFMNSQAVEVALKFTLSVPGVHTAIVGTTKPERWSQNAQLLAGGLLAESEFDYIRQRWQSVSDKSWVGQV